MLDPCRPDEIATDGALRDQYFPRRQQAAIPRCLRQAEKRSSPQDETPDRNPLLCPRSLAVAGTSAAATPTSQGSVKWRFQVSGQYVLHRPAVGPGGGVVVASSSGNVYSLTADGVLRWVRAAGSDGLSIGVDGTVYVGSMNTITAIAPDGSTRWAYTEPSVGGRIRVSRRTGRSTSHAASLISSR